MATSVIQLWFTFVLTNNFWMSVCLFLVMGLVIWDLAWPLGWEIWNKNGDYELMIADWDWDWIFGIRDSGLELRMERIQES